MFAGSTVNARFYTQIEDTTFFANTVNNVAVNGPVNFPFEFELARVTVRVVDPTGTNLTGWRVFNVNETLDYTLAADPNLTRGGSLFWQPGTSELLPIGTRGFNNDGRIILDNGLNFRFTIPQITAPNQEIVLTTSGQVTTATVSAVARVDGVPLALERTTIELRDSVTNASISTTDTNGPSSTSVSSCLCKRPGRVG